jgi:hypothetical protein
MATMDQPEKRHELLRVSEAPEVAEFGAQRDSGDELNAAQCHECCDDRL